MGVFFVIEIQDWEQPNENAFALKNEIKEIINRAINSRIQLAARQFFRECCIIAAGSFVLWATFTENPPPALTLATIDFGLIASSGAKNFSCDLMLKYDAFQYSRKLDRLAEKHAIFTPFSKLIQKSIKHLPESIKNSTNVTEEPSALCKETLTIEKEIFGLSF